MELRTLPLYFLLGGAVITAITYLGSHSKGLLAAMVAMLPVITIITLSTIYVNAGQNAAVNYFKGLLIILPAWFLYVLAVFLLMPRIGLVLSLVMGVSIYLAGALVTTLIVARF
jgi:uncharacterized membrane protein (GlpM family)